MDNKLLIAGVIGIAILGGLLYYYWDDLNNVIDYKKEESNIKNLANKKIKMKPVNINIENLNEL